MFHSASLISKALGVEMSCCLLISVILGSICKYFSSRGVMFFVLNKNVGKVVSYFITNFY